jgi:multicomponent K+:H+ antiporter subunit A
VLIGIIGLMISSGFVYLSAPDLALTQISVETVTIMLLLLALHFLPKETPVESSVRPAAARRGHAPSPRASASRRWPTASCCATSARSRASTSPIPTPKAAGTNVVNVILVDFRGYDTYGEIIVLGIAGLDDLRADGGAAARAGRAPPAQHGLLRRPLARPAPADDGRGDPRPDAHRVMVGVYIFLRGHNQPGGGFVAGLVVAIALLMQYMASGFAWTQARKRIDYHTMIGWGVIIAGLTGAGAWLFGPAVPDERYTYVTCRRSRSSSWPRRALRPRRVPDRARGGDADALQPVAIARHAARR